MQITLILIYVHIHIDILQQVHMHGEAVHAAADVDVTFDATYRVRICERQKGKRSVIEIKKKLNIPCQMNIASCIA